MDKKMTSGEIAKKTGISQKTVRLYDEKGLLKPSSYSEGNYRLYDEEALLVLEKIIALKQIGFSLEEIHDNLIAEKNMDIVATLEHQIEIMEAKKMELTRTIECIRSVLVRTNGQPDWNNVAEIVRMIQQDQKADERHFKALKHTVDNVDWYVKIYNSLELKKDSRVLDLGCGYGKLWRNNWLDIPENVTVDALDLHGSWAEDLINFVGEHKAELAAGTDIAIHWNDVEDGETWQKLQAEKPYNRVIAHYLFGFLKDKELFIRRTASVLAENGMFSCSGYGVSLEHQFWKPIFKELELSTAFIDKTLAEQQAQKENFRGLLEKYFSTVESVCISNKMQYENSEELFERLTSRYPEKKKYFAEHEKKIRNYFEKMIAQHGNVVMATDSQFWHCYK